MKHKKEQKKLSRSKSHRKALIKNLVSSLILNEYIVTTDTKAKVCKSFVDKIISMSKRNDLHTRRKLEKLLCDKLVVNKIINVLSERYKERNGGYVSIIKIRNRKGDNASLSKLILIGSEPLRIKKKSKAKVAKKTEEVKVEKKKEVEKQLKKQSIFDRVRSFRNKFKDKRKIETKKGKDLGQGVNKITKKSRSGI